MKRKSLVLFLSLGLLVSLLGASFSVFAEDYVKTGTVSLSRGGSSKSVVSDYVDQYTGYWLSSVGSVSFIGLPNNTWGGNHVVARARTYNGTYYAGPTKTFYYSTAGYTPYYEGFGGAQLSYTLYASMPSTEQSSGVTALMGFASY